MEKQIKNNSLRKEGILFLTYIRSFQQNEKVKEAIVEKKRKMKGKYFSIRSSPPKFCETQPIAILEFKNEILEKVQITKMKCKSWTCPKCNIKKALMVKYLLKEVIIKNNLSYFLTLTLDPTSIPSEYLYPENLTHKYITKIFNHFLVILKRERLKKKIKYVWVLEYQKNGNAHLHIVFNQFLPINKVRKLWVHTGGGVQMFIDKVKSIDGISSYVSDYIVKGIKGNIEGNNTFRYFEKRYSISRSCERPEKKISELFEGLTLQEKYLALQSSGLDWIYDALISEKEEVYKI